MRYAFCGDRQISVNILKFMIDKGYHPLLLIVNDSQTSTHSEELINTSKLEEKAIIYSSEIKQENKIALLREANLDYIIGIHFPTIIPDSVLKIPKVGFLNLHPAYLPYNKGWHTPSWAIIDETPYGATLHFMSEVLDGGDIIHQKQIEILPDDTANSLYRRVLKLEEEVFVEAFDDLLTLTPNRTKQTTAGTLHKKSDLSKISEIELGKQYTASDLINKMRALTTNNIQEAAYFVENDEKYLLQIIITKDTKE